MWKRIRKQLFSSSKQKARHEGMVQGEKQWTIERTKHNRRRVREKMCSHTSGTTCPEFFASGRTLTAEDMRAIENCRAINEKDIIETQENGWWVSKTSAEGEEEVEFRNKGYDHWESGRQEWLQSSNKNAVHRRPVCVERSLSLVVSICNDLEWSDSDKHDSDSW
jgi:hypothetical protein